MRDNKDETVREFWRLLAICHTVMVQEKDRERPPPPRGGARAPGDPEPLQPQPQGSLHRA